VNERIIRKKGGLDIGCELNCMNCNHSFIASKKEGLNLLTEKPKEYQEEFKNKHRWNGEGTVLVCTKGVYKDYPVSDEHTCENHSEF